MMETQHHIRTIKRHLFIIAYLLLSQNISGQGNIDQGINDPDHTYQWNQQQEMSKPKPLSEILRKTAYGDIFGGLHLICGHVDYFSPIGKKWGLITSAGMGIAKHNVSVFEIGLFTANNTYLTFPVKMSTGIKVYQYGFLEAGVTTAYIFNRFRDFIEVFPTVGLRIQPHYLNYDQYNKYLFRLFYHFTTLRFNKQPSGIRYEGITPDLWNNSYFGVSVGRFF
jgi:hypothetical protein